MVGSAALAMLAAGMLLAPANLLLLRSAATLVAIPILVALVGTTGSGLVARVLRAPLSQALGVLSFSFYLWNVPAFELLMTMAGPATAAAHPLATGLAVGLGGDAARAAGGRPVRAVDRAARHPPRPRLTRPAAPAATPAATTRC